MALVIATEGIDLSVGAVMALASAVVPLYLGYGVEAAIAMALVCGGAVAGLLNGFMVAVVGIQPIVATLAVLVGGRGVALVLADGRLTEMFDPTLGHLGSGELLGVPVNVIVAAVLALLVGAMVRRTIVGRQLVAVGGNREAQRARRCARQAHAVRRLRDQRRAGRDRRAARSPARSGAANPAYIGLTIELFAITAVVVGGTPLTGGRSPGARHRHGSAADAAREHHAREPQPDRLDRRIVTALIIVAAVALQRSRRPA